MQYVQATGVGWPDAKTAIEGAMARGVSFKSLRTEPVDPRLLVGTAFFIAGLQPEGCTKQLTEVEAARPFPWTRRLQSSWSTRREGSRGVTEHALYADDQLLAIRRDRLEQCREVIGEVAVVDDPARRVQHTHLHGPGVQVNARVKLLPTCVESHHGLLMGWGPDPGSSLGRSRHGGCWVQKILDR
jgi:hypothetical protein